MRQVTMNWLIHGIRQLNIDSFRQCCERIKTRKMRLPSPQRGRGAGGEGVRYAVAGCFSAQSPLRATPSHTQAPSPSLEASGGKFSFFSQLQKIVLGKCSRNTWLALACYFSFLFACQIAPTLQAAEEKLPPPVKSKIDFVRDVEPILHTKCYECHGSSMQMNGLRFDQKEAALKGGYSGPAIVPGSSAKSPLILRVASAKDGFKMPPAGPAVTVGETGLLRA